MSRILSLRFKLQVPIGYALSEVSDHTIYGAFCSGHVPSTRTDREVPEEIPAVSQCSVCVDLRFALSKVDMVL